MPTHTPTLQDQNIHRIQFSDLAQNGQIPGIEYLLIKFNL